MRMGSVVAGLERAAPAVVAGNSGAAVLVT
jgi:hypothetical protein